MRTQARKAIGPLIVGMILGMVVAARAEGPGKRDFPPPVPGWYPSGTLGSGRPGWAQSGGPFLWHRGWAHHRFVPGHYEWRWIPAPPVLVWVPGYVDWIGAWIPGHYAGTPDGGAWTKAWISERWE